eukprot:1943200-Prymnesium_polylepis.1
MRPRTSSSSCPMSCTRLHSTSSSPLASMGGISIHKYLIRMCGEEVFLKQKASPPQPTCISIDALGGHELNLFVTCVGVEGLKLSDLASGGSAFAGLSGGGNNRKWCDGCPHKNGSCICDP